MEIFIKFFRKLALLFFPDSFIKSMEEKLNSTNVALTGGEFCGISLFFSLLVGLVILALSLFIPFPYLPGLIYSIFGFFVVFVSLVFVLPYFLIQKRVNEIEEDLPDALRQMSNILRAGVGIDVAIEDVAQSEYGPLSEEFERAIDQVRRGRSMKGALAAMARRSRSNLLERAFFLIIEGMERGAELADVIESVSEDIRETQTLQRERKAATMQQILFLLVAALFVAPLVSGLVLTISEMFAGPGANGGVGLIGNGGEGVPGSVHYVIPGFLVIQSFITALAVGVIRYGKITKGLVFSVPFMLGAVLVFYLSRWASELFLL